MVYFISDGDGWIKIGIAKNVEGRRWELQCGNARPLKIIRQLKIYGIDDIKVESFLHSQFKEYMANTSNKTSEWFKEEPVLEFLKKTDKELDIYFNENLNGNNYQHIRAYTRNKQPLNQEQLERENKRLKIKIANLEDEVIKLKKERNSANKNTERLARELSATMISERKQGQRFAEKARLVFKPSMEDLKHGLK